MRISVKVDRTKNYIKVRKDIRERVERLIVYGTNEVRNTAITGITQGKKKWFYKTRWFTSICCW